MWCFVLPQNSNSKARCVNPKKDMICDFCVYKENTGNDPLVQAHLAEEARKKEKRKLRRKLKEKQRQH